MTTPNPMISSVPAITVDSIPNHQVAIELKNRKSRLSKERHEELQHILMGKILINDWVHTFDELMDNEVEGHLKATHPIFFRALQITTDWRYRGASILSFLWFAISFFTTLSPCFIRSDVKVTLVYSTAVFVMLCTTANTLANPNLFTGSINGKLNIHTLSNRDDPANFGFFRLLEAQLSLIRNLGQENSLPREGIVFRILLQVMPVVMAASYAVLLVLINLYWDPMVAYLSTTSESDGRSDCAIPRSFQYASAFLIAPLANACLSMYACLVTMCGLAIGCNVCGSMVQSWIKRYEAVKYLQIKSLPSTMSRAELRTDAYERYFLIHNCMARGSLIWNSYLVVYMFSSFVIFFYSTVIVYISIHSNMGLSQMLWQVTSFLAFVIPLYFVSSANAYNRRLETMFKYAVPVHLKPSQSIAYVQGGRSAQRVQGIQGENDCNASFEEAGLQGNYDVIGGRREWLDFVRDAPLYFTILGLPVTFEGLTTFVLGTAVSLLAATLPKVLLGLSAK